MAATVQRRAEAVGCPVPTMFLDAFENIFYSSRKIADNLFLVVHQTFLVIYPNFIFFRISCQILQKFGPWMPPVLHHAPVRTFLSSFLVI